MTWSRKSPDFGNTEAGATTGVLRTPALAGGAREDFGLQILFAFLLSLFLRLPPGPWRFDNSPCSKRDLKHLVHMLNRYDL